MGKGKGGKGKGRNNNTKQEAYSTWSSGIQIAQAKIFLMDDVEAIIAAIQEANGKDEISVMFKGELSGGGFCVYPEYYIPLQEKSTHSVDYHVGFSTEKERDESKIQYEAEGLVVTAFDMDGKYYLKENLHTLRNDSGYTTIVHSHPFSINPSFSGADDEHVNKQFPCSLLSNSEGEVCEGTILFKLADNTTLMQLEIDSSDIIRYDRTEPMEIKGLKKIRKKCTKVYNRGYNHDFSGHNNHYTSNAGKDKDGKGKNGTSNIPSQRWLTGGQDPGARERHRYWMEGIRKYKVNNYLQSLSDYEEACLVNHEEKMIWIEKNYFNEHSDAINSLNDMASLIYGKRKYGINIFDDAVGAYADASEKNDSVKMAWIELHFLSDSNIDTPTAITQEGVGK